MKKTECKVWVTRPAPQGAGLSRALVAAGFQVIDSPLLELSPSYLPRPALADTANAYLWTSPAAVHFSAAFCREDLSPHASFHAIGATTAHALAALGIIVRDTLVAPYTSEQWLAQARLGASSETQMMIIKGQGGRQTISQALRAQGYAVHHWDVYQRNLPPQAIEAIQSFTELPLIIASSCEILSNLDQLLQHLGLHAWYHAPILATSPRIQARAMELGFRRVHLAQSAETGAIVRALMSLSQIDIV